MSKNGFKDYLIEIGKYPLLTADQELELGQRIKEDNDESAREAFICSNLRLVVYIAKAYQNQHLGMEDLVAEGNVGLMTAVDKYDYSLGYRFSTFATPWIKQSILKAITDKGRPIRLPAHIYQQLNKVKRYINDFEGTEGRAPTNEEIAKALDIEPEKVASLLEWQLDTVSMDTPIGDEEKNTVGDLVADSGETPVEYTEKMMRSAMVQEMLLTLPERTRIIMKMRYGVGSPEDPEDWQNEHTLEEIGDHLGITRERVRQIEKETLQLLKLTQKGEF